MRLASAPGALTSLWPVPVGIEQRADGHPKCDRQLVDNRDRRVARAAFQIADIGPMNPGLAGELFLRPASGKAEPTQIGAEALDDVHEREIAAMSTINLQTISDIPLDHMTRSKGWCCD